MTGKTAINILWWWILGALALGAAVWIGLGAYAEGVRLKALSGFEVKVMAWRWVSGHFSKDDPVAMFAFWSAVAAAFSAIAAINQIAWTKRRDKLEEARIIIEKVSWLAQPGETHAGAVVVAVRNAGKYEATSVKATVRFEGGSGDYNNKTIYNETYDPAHVGPGKDTLKLKLTNKVWENICNVQKGKSGYPELVDLTLSITYDGVFAREMTPVRFAGALGIIWDPKDPDRILSVEIDDRNRDGMGRKRSPARDAANPHRRDTQVHSHPGEALR